MALAETRTARARSTARPKTSALFERGERDVLASGVGRMKALRASSSSGERSERTDAAGECIANVAAGKSAYFGAWWSRLLAIAVSAFVVTACGNRHLARADKNYQRVVETPGAKQVGAYIEGITHGLRRGAARNPEELAGFETHGRQAFEQAKSVMAVDPSSRPHLLALLGLMEEQFDRGQHALELLWESHRLKPNILASSRLVSHHSASNDQAMVHTLCQATTMAIADPSARYEFIEFCMAKTNAINAEASLAWATPDILAFYRDGRQQLARQAAQRERANNASRACQSTCAERASYCRSRCHTTHCDDRCIDAYNACNSRCW